jgi:hypothetical protein
MPLACVHKGPADVGPLVVQVAAVQPPAGSSCGARSHSQVHCTNIRSKDSTHQQHKGQQQQRQQHQQLGTAEHPCQVLGTPKVIAWPACMPRLSCVGNACDSATP